MDWYPLVGVRTHSTRTCTTFKKEVQVIGRDTTQSVIHVKLDNIELKQTEDFVYLGGTVSSDTSCDKDTARRVGLAAGVAQSLEKNWKTWDKNISIVISQLGSVHTVIQLWNMDVKRREQKIATSVSDVSPEEDFGPHEKRPCTQCRHHEGPCTGHGHCRSVTSESSNVLWPLHSHEFQQVSTYPAV